MIDEQTVENKNPKIGLALSGGMQIGALAGAAILRGFQLQKIHLGIDEEGKQCRPSIQAFDYISGLSGGIIPTIQYTYGQDCTSAEILDAKSSLKILDPADITKESLERYNDASILHSLAETPVVTEALPRIMLHAFRMDLQAGWTATMHKRYLKPLGIKRNKNFACKPVTFNLPSTGEKMYDLSGAGSQVQSPDLVPEQLVAETARNDVIKYDLSGGLPAEKIIKHEIKLPADIKIESGKGAEYDLGGGSLSSEGTPKISASEALESSSHSSDSSGSSGYSFENNNTITPRSDVRAIPLITFAMVGRVGEKKLFTGGRKKGAEFTESFMKIKEHAKGLAGTFVSPRDVKFVLKKVNNVVFVPYVASPEGVGTAFNLPMTLESGDTFDDLSGMCEPCHWGRCKEKRGNTFSLEHALAMGTNTAAIGGLKKAKEDKDADYVKRYNTITQRRVVKTGKDEESELLFSDGGLVETLGVPALVQKKTRYIISSICGHGPKRKYSDHYNRAKGHDLTTWLMEASTIGIADVASYFGFYSGLKEGFLLNHIFSDGEARLDELRNKFDALYEAGMPLITTLKDLDVIDNPYWGTVAGEKVDLTIIYWTAPKVFSSQVPRAAVPPPDDVYDTVDKETGEFTNKDLSGLPHFGAVSNFETKTKTWNIIRSGALSRTQVNMMSYLGTWMVKEAWNGLYLDGKEMFCGFKEILEKSD